MKHYYLHKANHPCLTLFFAGWGMDEHPFRDYHPADSDLLMLYDYRSLTLDAALLQGYREVRVVGWSMGVWAAGQVLPHLDLPLTESIALNGTPTPIDDREGIPQAIYQGTLEGLNERNLRKFYRRMCGSAEATENFLQRAPLRPLEELKEELEDIGRQSLAGSVSPFVWTRALVGTGDLIFAAANQQQAWSHTDTEVLTRDMPHYAEGVLREVLLRKGNL